MTSWNKNRDSCATRSLAHSLTFITLDFNRHHTPLTALLSWDLTHLYPYECVSATVNPPSE